MNDSQQLVAAGFLIVFLAITFVSLSDVDAIKNPFPKENRNFHASAGIPVEMTSDVPTMVLRDSKAVSYHSQCSCNHADKTNGIPTMDLRDSKAESFLPKS